MTKTLKLKAKKSITQTTEAITTAVIRKTAKNRISEAQGDQRFFVINGQVLSRIEEIPQALEAMDDSTYNYHVNAEKNDFANWIGMVFLDGTLSKKAIQAKDRKALSQVIAKAVK